MKKINLWALALLLVVSCSKEDSIDAIDETPSTLESQKMMSVEQINAHIKEELERTGDLDWKNISANVLWSTIMHGGGYVTIGYGNKGESFSKVRSSRLNDAKQNIINIAASAENKSTSSIVTHDDGVFNYVEIKVDKLSTVVELQDADQIRYIQPSSYEFFFPDVDLQKSFGCAKDGRQVNPEDYRVISPNAWLPWTFDIHNIPQAWNYSTGAGITVGVIDSGVSQNQKFLGSDFNDGFSNGRTVEKFGTFDGSIYDDCGHGTAMSAAIASPRNDDAMPVGVAYNSNLVSYRGTGDVLLDSRKERKAVSQALRELADKPDVKIISMSIGWVWSVGNIKDAVKYAYSKGKMVVAAGGTSTSFTNWYAVIFPASMSETVAVTGVREDGNRCNICHDGKKIDFTVMMQRNSDGDRTMPVLGFRSDVRNVVGGSSIATATTAGIAALVWAQNPNMTREQVLDKMKRAGEFYPDRSNKFGYGKIDALKAVQ